MTNKQKKAQVVEGQVCRMSKLGQPAVISVTAAISGPVSSSTVPSLKLSANALPLMTSSMVVTTVSSAITSMAVALQTENVPMPMCSKMGVKQPLNSAQGTEEMIKPVSKYFVRGVTSVAGTLSAVATPLSAMLYGHSSHSITSSLTDVQNTITVTMLGYALQTVNVRMLGSGAMTRADESVVQSLLQCIQKLESLNAENVVLHERIADLEAQAFQAQSLASVYPKKETKSSDVAVVTDADHKDAKCKKKQSRNSAKKAHLTLSASLSSSLGAETNNSNGDTELLLSTSS